jgi:hypothetical protein
VAGDDDATSFVARIDSPARQIVNHQHACLLHLEDLGFSQ